jgi:hypothetical protein
VDKVMMASAFICLVPFKAIPAWVATTVVARDFLITGLRLLAGTRGLVLPAERLGKHKTSWQIITILFFLVRLSAIEVPPLESYSEKLWDYWERRSRDVGFCLLHVTRNPLATFLSQRRAQQTGVWRCTNGTAPPSYPWSTNSDWTMEDVVEHVRRQDSWQARVERISDDRLDIPYSQVLDFPLARRRLCEFMELLPHKIQPTTKPLGGVRALERISLEGLERLPPDVARHLQYEFI